MRPAALTATLSAIPARGAGTDAERRAANAVAQRLEQEGLTVTPEPFWCRPNTALAHAWHALLALAGSLLSVGSPRAGAALILMALASLVIDELTGVSLGRRLTPERASQSLHARSDPSRPRARVRLILAAELSCGRAGLLTRRAVRAPAVAAQRALGGRAPGWLAWLALMMVWLLVCALLRAGGGRGPALGALQLPPTVAMVIALALLIELGTAVFAPAGGDGASGAAVAAALATTLHVTAPGSLEVELLLAGAGNLGVRHHLRRRRQELTASNTVVLGFARSDSGDPRWWISDGPFVPLRYLPALQAICEAAAMQQPELRARRRRGRGRTPALPARAARLPAIALGTADGASRTADSATPVDMDSVLAFALALTDGIDADVRARRARSTPAPTRV